MIGPAETRLAALRAPGAWATVASGTPCSLSSASGAAGGGFAFLACSAASSFAYSE